MLKFIADSATNRMVSCVFIKVIVEKRKKLPADIKSNHKIRIRIKPYFNLELNESVKEAFSINSNVKAYYSFAFLITVP